MAILTDDMKRADMLETRRARFARLHERHARGWPGWNCCGPRACCSGTGRNQISPHFSTSTRGKTSCAGWGRIRAVP